MKEYHQLMLFVLGFVLFLAGIIMMALAAKSDGKKKGTIDNPLGISGSVVMVVGIFLIGVVGLNRLN